MYVILETNYTKAYFNKRNAQYEKATNNADMSKVEWEETFH